MDGLSAFEAVKNKPCRAHPRVEVKGLHRTKLETLNPFLYNLVEAIDLEQLQMSAILMQAKLMDLGIFRAVQVDLRPGVCVGVFFFSQRDVSGVCAGVGAQPITSLLQWFFPMLPHTFIHWHLLLPMHVYTSADTGTMLLPMHMYTSAPHTLGTLSHRMHPTNAVCLSE